MWLSSHLERMNLRFPRDAIQAAACRQPTAAGEFRDPTDRETVYTHPGGSGWALNVLRTHIGTGQVRVRDRRGRCMRECPAGRCDVRTQPRCRRGGLTMILTLVLLVSCHRAPDGILLEFGYRPAELAQAVDYRKILVVQHGPVERALVVAAVEREGGVMSSCEPRTSCDNRRLFLVETPHRLRGWWNFDPFSEPELADHPGIMTIPDPGDSCSCVGMVVGSR